jgi:hypothetical protein
MSNDTSPDAGEVMYINPPTLLASQAFTNVVVVRGAQMTVYIGAQYAIDVAGTVVGPGD